MNKLLKKPVLAAALFFLAGLALPAPGADGPSKKTGQPGARAELHKAPVQVPFDAKHVSIVRKAPVPHKPFDLLHPGTGKKVTPDTQLKLPNGKTVKAQEYYAELNRLEKKLNALGHSLRDSGKNVLLVQTKLDPKALEAKARAVEANHRPPAKGTVVPNRAALMVKHKDALARNAQRLKAINKAKAKGTSGIERKAPGQVASCLAIDEPEAKRTVGAARPTTLKTWDLHVGSPRVVSAFLKGKVVLDGNQDAVAVLSEATAGGYLVGHPLKLLETRGRVQAGATSKVQLNVALAGFDLVNLSEQDKTSWSKSGQFSKTFDHSAQFRFMLGPIPLNVRVGAQGSVGATYFVAVNPMHATIQVVPTARAQVYAQASLDAVVARAGVGGSLKLLDTTLAFGAEVSLQHDSGGLYLQEHLYADSQLEMLAGNLYVFAEVTVPRFGLPPWETRHYHWALFQWRGLKVRGHLFPVVDRKAYLLGGAGR